jgi:hypothetical protein
MAFGLRTPSRPPPKWHFISFLSRAPTLALLFLGSFE